MSPTSCRCSTPRHVSLPLTLDLTYPDDRPRRMIDVGVEGCPQRPRLPQGHPCSTLRRCGGSRPGSGWDRVGPPRSRPRAPLHLHSVTRFVPSSQSISNYANTHQQSITWSNHRCFHPLVIYRGQHFILISEEEACPAWGTEPIDRCSHGIVDRGCPRSLGRVGSGPLLAVHLPPINPVVSRGAYLFRVGNVVLGGDSRLDAFSGSPVRT